MRAIRTFMGLCALVLLYAGGGAHAATFPGISQHVAVCNPDYPTRCMKPAADGSIPTTGGGGGGGGAVTIASGADVVEGATGDTLSTNTVFGNLQAIKSGVGAVGDAACATDNGSCSVDSVAKRIAQRLTSLITALGTPMQQTGGSVSITGTPTFNCGTGCSGGNTAVAPTDASTTVTTGGTFQTVFSQNSSRTSCFIQNPTTATEALYVHYTVASATTANSVSLGAGASFTCGGNGGIVTNAVSVTGATTGHAFIATGS